MITPLIKTHEIEKRIAELGEEITKDFNGEEIVVVGILNGSFLFCADLCRKINLEQEIDFMSISSYGDGMESSGNVRVDLDLRKSITGKNVLIVEDIVDSGKTISKLKELLLTRNPKTLKICTLLSKPSRRKIETKIDYIGFTIDAHFIVGYGLDDQGKKRNLNFVGVKT